MLVVAKRVWPLFFGISFAMVGNAVQGTVLGIFAEQEGIEGLPLSLVISAYFAGIVLGALIVPNILRVVGHARLFPLLALLLALALLAYPVLAHWGIWIVLRMLSGVCMCGIYITLESWLNGTVENSQRGRLLSIYISAQMTGAVLAQSVAGLSALSIILPFATAAVCVLLAALPALMTKMAAPAHVKMSKIAPLSLLVKVPLSCVGTLVLGAILAAIYGMGSIWGVKAELSIEEITAFTGSLFVGGLVTQLPIGRASDRFGRPHVMLIVSLFGAIAAISAFLIDGYIAYYLIAAFCIGGATNGLNGLFIAYAHDRLERETMASGAAGLLLLNAFGAVLGPIAIQQAMSFGGASSYFLSIGTMFVVIAALVIGLSIGSRTRPLKIG